MMDETLNKRTLMSEVITVSTQPKSLTLYIIVPQLPFTWRSSEKCRRFDVNKAVVGQKVSHLHDNVRAKPKVRLQDRSPEV